MAVQVTGWFLATVFGLLACSAEAATLIVTTIADTDDGICDADCLLREAVNTANTNAGHDSIAVPPGVYTLTMGGYYNGLLIFSNLDIVGAGPALTVLDGNAADSVIHILSNSIVRIVGVTIRNGHADGGGGIDLNA